MSNIITEVWASYRYGARELTFSKKFDLPFPPFFGMRLNDYKGDNEVTVDFSNDDYNTTMIDWDMKLNRFVVDVNYYWKRPVRDDVIDETIEMFISCGWKRKDTTDIPSLKELMKAEHERMNPQSPLLAPTVKKEEDND